MQSKSTLLSSFLKIQFLFMIAAAIGMAPPRAYAELTQAQIEAGKKATALVQVTIPRSQEIQRTGRGSRGANPSPVSKGPTIVNATAFCIHSAGWFVTCAHVTTHTENGKLRLILNSGEKDQAIVETKVIRADKDKDLALLKVPGGGPFTALALGKVDGLTETTRLTAFGYPFGEDLALADNTYPAISVSQGAVTSLRKKDGKLEVIQLDASLNPGNSGGPVLDSEARVVGIVAAGIEGAAVNFAVPISHLVSFLAEPEVELVAPALNLENMSKPASFKAKVLAVLGNVADYTADLTLKTAGAQRKIAMKREADGFSAMEVPVPPEKGPLSIELTANFGRSSVTGIMTDASFTVGGKPCRLSKVQLLEGGSKPNVIEDDGTLLEGTIAGLSSVTVTLDDMKTTLDLTKAKSVTMHPIGVINTVEYELAISKGGKVVKTDAGTITISNGGSTVWNIAPSNSGLAQLGAKTTSSQTGEPQFEVKLPGDIADVAVGGNRLILHLRKLRQFAIFDVGAGKIVKYLPLDSDDILFTAGAEKLIVVFVAQNLIARYSLSTFEREVIAQMPVKGTIKAIAMGSNSRGPLLVVSSEETSIASITSSTFSLVNPNTLAVIKAIPKEKLGQMPMPSRDNFQIRVSTDGTVFSMWSQSGGGSTGTLALEGDDLTIKYLNNYSGTSIPGPDATVIYTEIGLYTPEMKLIGSASPQGSRTLRVPAIQGNYYLEIEGIGRIDGIGRTDGIEKIAVCLAGDSRTLATLPSIIDLKEYQPPGFPTSQGRDPLSRDKRLSFFPYARLIIGIPTTNDRLILRQFDPLQALKNAKIDYLFVSSSPVTTATKNALYSYPIQVESKRGGVTFTLESGPADMKITPSGKLTWNVSASAGESTVIVRITDASSQEIFHTFKISAK
jgi:S1-C subfamily serine protease